MTSARVEILRCLDKGPAQAGDRTIREGRHKMKMGNNEGRDSQGTGRVRGKRRAHRNLGAQQNWRETLKMNKEIMTKELHYKRCALGLVQPPRCGQAGGPALRHTPRGLVAAQSSLSCWRAKAISSSVSTGRPGDDNKRL